MGLGSWRRDTVISTNSFTCVFDNIRVTFKHTHILIFSCELIPGIQLHLEYIDQVKWNVVPHKYMYIYIFFYFWQNEKIFLQKKYNSTWGRDLFLLSELCPNKGMPLLNPLGNARRCSSTMDCGDSTYSCQGSNIDGYKYCCPAKLLITGTVQ